MDKKMSLGEQMENTQETYEGKDLFYKVLIIAILISSLWFVMTVISSVRGSMEISTEKYTELKTLVQTKQIEKSQITKAMEDGEITNREYSDIIKAMNISKKTKEILGE